MAADAADPLLLVRIVAAVAEAACHAPRHTAGAMVAAAVRSVLAVRPSGVSPDADAEVQARLTMAEPALMAKVLGHSGSGSARACRNFALHADLGCGASQLPATVQEAKRRGRGGRRRRPPTVVNTSESEPHTVVVPCTPSTASCDGAVEEVSSVAGLDVVSWDDKVSVCQGDHDQEIVRKKDVVEHGDGGPSSRPPVLRSFQVTPGDPLMVQAFRGVGSSSSSSVRSPRFIGELLPGSVVRGQVDGSWLRLSTGGIVKLKHLEPVVD